VGDKYAGLWPRERFQKCGIEYKVAELTRSELYLSFLPILMSGKCELLDNKKLVSQLCSLERRTARSGKDSIDHPPSGHDDLANSVAGALVEALGGFGELGFLKYLEGVQAGIYPAEQQPAQSGDPFSREAERAFELKLMGAKPAGASEEIISPCRCGGARTFINGCGFRCSQCGATYAKSTDTEPTSVVRDAGPCCDSPLLTPIPGGQRCNSCGWQSNLNQPTNGVPRSQLETFSGGRANFHPKGFMVALARLFGAGRK
jgi:hypothetical protein